MSTTVTKDVIRVVLFVLAWANSLLVAHGHKPLPIIDENQIYWVITFGVSVWAMVKEAPFKNFFAKKPAEAPAAPAEAPSEDPIKPVPVEAAPAPQVAPAEAPAEPRAPEAAPVEEPAAPVAPAPEAPKAN